MSFKPVLVPHVGVMTVAALALALGTAATQSRAAAAPTSAAAATAAPSIVPALGTATHYRIARTTQGNPDSQTIVSDVILRHKTPSTVTLEGNIGGRSFGQTVLNYGVDGSLQIPKNDRTDAQDAQLSDLVAALNRMSALLANGSGPPPGGWNASLVVSEVPGANAPVIVPVAVSNLSGGDFDLHGIGELSVQAPSGGGGPPSGGGGNQHGGGFHGGGGGGGYRGMGDGAQASPRPEYQRQPFTVAIGVDGKVRHGAIARLSLVETRGVTIDALPFVNVSSWTLEALR